MDFWYIIFQSNVTKVSDCVAAYNIHKQGVLEFTLDFHKYFHHLSLSKTCSSKKWTLYLGNLAWALKQPPPIISITIKLQDYMCFLGRYLTLVRPHTWKVFTPIICLYFWLFMKCGAMAGELRLGESARILKNTRELLFSRSLSNPAVPALSLSFSLSHWLLQIPWPPPGQLNTCSSLFYIIQTDLVGREESHCLYGLSEFGSFSRFSHRDPRFLLGETEYFDITN